MVDCEKHRTISLTSQVGGVILRVIKNTIDRKIEKRIDEKQFGFRKSGDTWNAIFILSMLIERAPEMKNDIYLGYVDFSKAFDRVKHDEMMEILGEAGIVFN